MGPDQDESKITTELTRLATAVEVSNERWLQQSRTNHVLLEGVDRQGRAIFGHNGDEGLVGRSKTQAVKIGNLEEAEAEHADRLKFARRLVIGAVATVLGALASSGVLVYLGWK